MSLNAKTVPRGGKAPDPIDPGSYPARLVQVIGLGLQPQEYQGETKEPKLELSTTYELLDEFMKNDDGEDDETKPRWITESFALHNLAADKAKSTARYYALDPDGKVDGDWTKLLNTPAMVTVTIAEGKGKNKGRIYNNIGGLSTMRAKEAAKAKLLVNKPKYFDPSEPDIDVFMSLPDWLQKKIKDGLEYGGSELESLVENYKPKGDKKTVKDEVETNDEEEDKSNW